MTLDVRSVDGVSLVVADFERGPSPKIRSMEKFSGDDFFVEGVFSEPIERKSESTLPSLRALPLLLVVTVAVGLFAWHRG